MAQPKTVIPRRRRGSHNPGGGKPRHIQDASELSELDREERQFRERRAAERANSKPIRVMVRAPIYLKLLNLCEKFGREPKMQAELCLELGVRFYENDNTAAGGARPLDMLPEVLQGTVVESGDAPMHRAPPRADRRVIAGWMGDDAGLPVASTQSPWTQPPELPAPEVALAPIQESEPQAESLPAFPESPAETAEEEIEVPV